MYSYSQNQSQKPKQLFKQLVDNNIVVFNKIQHDITSTNPKLLEIIKSNEQMPEVNNDSIQSLYISSSELISTRGIQLKNLEVLKLYYNTHLRSIQNIVSCIHLKELYLNGNPELDISPLELMVNLTKLKLDTYQDIWPIQDLIRLQTLDLCCNANTDIKTIKNLVNLSDLTLKYGQLINIDSLSKLLNIEKLNLQKNLLKNIQPLQQLINLSSLNLSSNQLQNIWTLRYLTNLKELDLSYNKDLCTITSLSELIKLIKLNLHHCQIHSIYSLRTLKNLENLDISENNIIDAYPLEHLMKLKKLNLCKNKIVNNQSFKRIIWQQYEQNVPTREEIKISKMIPKIDNVLNLYQHFKINFQNMKQNFTQFKLRINESIQQMCNEQIKFTNIMVSQIQYFNLVHESEIQ
ncbi:leucine-rich_repeat domain-containing protein [Hexamita inflata]|uniref:Leucine-rich repeat domain-containing protein n=1 Tax=Hexamita inflata TaxID=28002 RepID=A0AA86R8N1_9EUKA|nr:leucine-rich repeat domain-containing protein [Hexamita inflata]